MISCSQPMGHTSFLINKYRALSTDDFSELSLKNGDEIYLMDDGRTIYYDEANDTLYYSDGSIFGENPGEDPIG